MSENAGAGGNRPLKSGWNERGKHSKTIITPRLVDAQLPRPFLRDSARRLERAANARDARDLVARLAFLRRGPGPDCPTTGSGVNLEISYETATVPVPHAIPLTTSAAFQIYLRRSRVEFL
jgi:hypothetical protein